MKKIAIRLATVLATVASGTIVLLGVDTGTASAGPAGGCAVNTPCVAPLTATSTLVRARWTYGKVDKFIVKWDITYPNGLVDNSIRQFDTTDRDAAVGIDGRLAGATLRIGVKACNVRLLGGSACTDWGWGTIVLPKPHGTDTCKTGFVWREAYKGDHTCVTPGSRTQAATDNAEAAARRIANSSYCRTGYVWREANPRDVVCVTPAVRAATAEENRLGPSRRA